MLVENFGKRTVVVSGCASSANEFRAPMRPAAPTDESVERKRRRVCIICMMPHLLRRALRRNVRTSSSSLQLALELVEKAPIGPLRDDFVWAGLDHSGFAQPQRVEAQGILGVVIAPERVAAPSH